MPNPNKSVSTEKYSNRNASIVSTDEIPSATIPTQKAREESVYEWKKLTRTAIMRREYSQQPELFLVELHLTSEFRISHGNVKEVIYEKLYEEYHPYLAIGKAIVDIGTSIISPKIENLNIYRRVIKNRK